MKWKIEYLQFWILIMHNLYFQQKKGEWLRDGEAPGVVPSHSK
jgi:hypothetical protein